MLADNEIASATAVTSLLPADLSPWGMFASADGVVQTVMAGLVLASLLTWIIGIAKSLELRGAKGSVRRALRDAAMARSLAEARKVIAESNRPEALLLAASLAETQLSADVIDLGQGTKERVAARLERLEGAAIRSMMRGTGLLATVGATAPFVGLFGTVWGIMNSFIGISRAHTTNLAVVAPGIAEALLATGLGLFAAIPAVVLYNALARDIAVYRGLLGDFSSEIQRHLSRDLDRHQMQAAQERMTGARHAHAAPARP